MNWDDDALALIQKAPAMVRPMIRQKIEANAKSNGLDRIDADFVNSLANQQHGEADSQNIEKYYAVKSDNPLAEAFVTDSDVHVFGSGQNLTSQQSLKRWQEMSRISKPANRRRSLYIHVPFCRSRCVFCPFYANRWNADAIKDYAKLIVQEIRQLAGTEIANSKINAVYFGGGTPSDLAAGDLQAILSAIHNTLSLASDAEITLEGRVWSQGSDIIQTAVNSGVNRFSIGVQSFDTRLRRSLGRKADRTEVLRFLAELTNTTNASVVIDLIYGLPGQTMQNWTDDLKILHEQSAVHGADLYRLKSMPQSELEKMIDSGKLPEKADANKTSLMFATSYQYMQQNRWQQLNGPHWARDTRERSLYNTMVKSGDDCIPVGCGAGGRIGSVRFFQTSDISQYAKAVADNKKPVNSAIDLGPQYVLTDEINRQFESKIIEPEKLALSNKKLIENAKKLLSQWSFCGLLDCTSDGSYKLSMAGEFWSVQMASRLTRLLSC